MHSHKFNNDFEKSKIPLYFPPITFDYLWVDIYNFVFGDFFFPDGATCPGSNSSN
jgi:hypothetical protein